MIAAQAGGAQALKRVLRETQKMGPSGPGILLP